MHEIAQDKENPAIWHVSDDEAMASFSGPRAKELAQEYATWKREGPFVVDVRRAARMLSVDEGTFSKLYATGRLGPEGFLIDGKRFFAVDELKCWILANRPDRRSFQAMARMAARELLTQGHAGGLAGAMTARRFGGK